MSNEIAAYWWILIPLAALALAAIPRHNPRPEKEAAAHLLPEKQ